MSQSFGSYLRTLTACHENVNLSHETGIYSGKYTSTPAEPRVYIPKPEIRALKPDVRAVKPDVRALNPRIRARKPTSSRTETGCSRAEPTSSRRECPSLFYENRFTKNTRASLFRTHIKNCFYAAKHKHSTCPRAYAVKYASTPAELRVYIPKPEIRALKPDVRAVNPRVRAVKPDVRARKPRVRALNPRIRAVKPDVRAVNVRVYFTRTDLRKTLVPHCSARI